MAKGKPWEDAPDLWKDEKQFMSSYLRSAIRKIWSRHPIKHRYCNSRPTLAIESREGVIYHQGTDDVLDPRDVRLGVAKIHPNTKKLRSCEICGKWFPVGKLVVDHLEGGYGFSTHEELVQWMSRQLWVGFDDIREICKPCHEKVNTMQRTGCTWEEVPMQQELAAFKKLKAGPMRKQLSKLGLPEGNNEAVRIETFTAYLKEKYNAET